MVIRDQSFDASRLNTFIGIKHVDVVVVIAGQLVLFRDTA